MALAETAELAVLLKLQDQMSGPLKAVNGQVKALEAGTAKAAATSTTGFNNVGKAATKAGDGLKHAGSQLKGLALGLGLFGGVAAGVGIASFFEQGIDKARDFGAEVQKLVKVTGLAPETVSALAAALEHFGVGSDTALRSISLLEKNVGNLTATQKSAAKFQATYGFALEDANGHVKDANTLTLQLADYFNNKAIPAQTKAAALAKLFGRNWQQLIPVLSAGSKGIKDAADEAAQLGLTLNSQNLQDLAKLREQTRNWNTALGGLQLQLGLLLTGPLTDLTKAATDFISDPNNRRSLLGFFKGVIQTARDVGSFIGGTVIPTIQGLASAAKSFWNQIPPPLRDLLVKGVVADRTIKFLFGVSPIRFAAGALGGLLKGALGGIFQRGGSPANPMWVASAGDLFGGATGGGLKGILVDAIEGAGIAGAVTTGLLVAFAAVGLPAAIAAFTTIPHDASKPNSGGPGSNTLDPFAPGVGTSLLPPGAMAELGRQIAAAEAAASSKVPGFSPSFRERTNVGSITNAISTGFLRVLDAAKMTGYLSELKKRMGDLKKELTGKRAGSEGAKLIAARIEGVKAKEDQTKAAINALRNSTNPRLTAVQNRIALDGIRLRSLQQRLAIAQDAHDGARAARLRAKIQDVKHDQDIANAKLQRIANKKEQVVVNTTNNFSALISVRDQMTSLDNKTRYSKTFAVAR